MKELLDTFHTIPANWKVVEKDGFPLASGAYVVLRGLRDALFDFPDALILDTAIYNGEVFLNPTSDIVSDSGDYVKENVIAYLPQNFGQMALRSVRAYLLATKQKEEA